MSELLTFEAVSDAVEDWPDCGGVSSAGCRADWAGEPGAYALVGYGGADCPVVHAC